MGQNRMFHTNGRRHLLCRKFLEKSCHLVPLHDTKTVAVMANELHAPGFAISSLHDLVDLERESLNPARAPVSTRIFK